MIFYIFLDNLSKYDYCYHLPNHTVVFNSHPDSISVLKLDEVISDSKKGIRQYFNEKFNYYKIELNQYLLDEIFFTCTNLIDKINFFINIIENYNISIYEIKSIFFSHGIYTLSFDNLKKLIDPKHNVNIDSLYRNTFDPIG